MGKKQNLFQEFMKKATNRVFFVVGALFLTISAFAAGPNLPTPPVLRIFVYPDVLEFAINKHISVMYRNAVATEWQNRMGTDGSVTADDIRAVCQIAHLNTNECNAFQKDLMTYFYDVCDKGKGKSGGKEHCVNDFQSLTTNMLQAVGLAKLYAYKNDNVDKLVCKTNPRIESHTTHSGVRGGMNAGGMPSSTTTNHYVQCRAVNKNLFYEFKFSNTRGTSDNVNHRSFKTGICSVYGYKFQGATKKDNREKSGWDICDGTGINTANCEKINNGLSVAHTGYFASWGPKTRTLSTGKHGRVNEAGAGYKLDASNLPYCILTANAGIKYDGTAYERTAFGLNGRYFLSKDIQTQGTEELHEYIRKYVQSTGVKIESFSCENTYVTVQLAGRSDPDDMITCTINGSTVDFFFDDLSESKGKYIRGAKQALDCKVAGGAFTGSKCMGLNEEQCGIVRAANARTCPECSKIQWNSIDKICELPASASAQNLRRGLTYAAMVGGAAVSVVITVGTLGTATAPTAVVLTGLAVELLGAGIELKAQKAIDAKADEFFVKANNCKNPDCAEKLIKEYLQALSNQQNDLSDTEIEAADRTFEDLFEIIPADSKFYKDIVELGIKSQNLEGNKRGFFDAKSWNSEQIWRAVGVTLQVIPTLASVGLKIAKKSDKLVRSTAKLRGKIETASKHIDDALGVRQQKVIGYLNEVFTPSVNTDDFIKQLEKEGYRVEYVSETDFFGQTKKRYKILADVDKDEDIEQIQIRLLKDASDADRDARLTLLGNYYAPTETPDSWYNTYKEIVTEYLSKDPDIMAAQRDWKTMSEWERYKFANQTNRKIRHLISENPLPVSYGRPGSGAGGSYGVQRLGSDAAKNAELGIDHDIYSFGTDTSFDQMIDRLVHENYHYSQDIGKTEMPKWLLDFNIDNYTDGGHKIISEYHAQPVEKGVSSLGSSVAKAVNKNITSERLVELRDYAVKLQQMDDALLVDQEFRALAMESPFYRAPEISAKQWAEDMINFIDAPTKDKLFKFQNSCVRISSTYEIPEEIRKRAGALWYDSSFWDGCKDLTPDYYAK